MHKSLARSRYALLRTYRRDGTPIDTPIWFALEGTALVFRTKVGPKTKRLSAQPRVELRPCDHKGRVTEDAKPVTGLAHVLSGAAAELGNRALHKRYGWQYNVVPMIKIPGATNVHAKLPLREKLRRMRDRGVWADSAIVQIDLDPAPS